MTHLFTLFLLVVFANFVIAHTSQYEFNEVVKQKTFGNKIPQCPCVVHRESRQCVSYDSRYLAANVEEAILAFIDLSNHEYSVQIVNSETFQCASTECRQCYALLYYRLQEVGLVNGGSRTTISPLPRAQLRPELCPKFRFLLQPMVPPTPFAVPTFMRDMINAGQALQAQTVPVPPIPLNQNRQQQNQQNNQPQQNQGQGTLNGPSRPQNNQNNQNGQNNQWNQGRPNPSWNQQNQNNWQNQPRPQQPIIQQPFPPNRGFQNWPRPPPIIRPPWNPQRPMPQQPWIPQPLRPPPLVQYPPRVPQWNPPTQQPSWPGQWTPQPQQPQQPSWTTSPSPSYTPAYNWPAYQPAVSIPSAVGTTLGGSLGHPILDLLGGLFGGGGGQSPPQHGGHSFLGGGFRHKRQAVGDLGVKFTIGCTNRGEADGELLALCGYCWTWRQLPEDYFPRILNELSCQEGDYCLSGWGMCKQQFRNIDVLHRVNGRWIPTVITSASCCDCRVKAGTEIHSLVVGDKR